MKILISILSIVFLAKDCKNTPSTSQKVQDNLEIIYTANSRGFYEYIKVAKNTISISKDRDLNTITSIKCPAKDWNALLALISKIDTSKISELEPPSKKFQFDGAPMATLEFKTTKLQSKTPIFDHGNPPKVIAEIVAKVLTLKHKAQQN